MRLAQVQQAELLNVLAPLCALESELQLNGYLHEESVDFLGNFKFWFPNEAKADTKKAKKGSEPKSRRNQFRRRGRGRRRNNYGDNDVRALILAHRLVISCLLLLIHPVLFRICRMVTSSPKLNPSPKSRPKTGPNVQV